MTVSDLGTTFSVVIDRLAKALCIEPIQVHITHANDKVIHPPRFAITAFAGVIPLGRHFP
jgi:hypothetical protein